jgi:hypothetical protein
VLGCPNQKFATAAFDHRERKDCVTVGLVSRIPVLVDQTYRSISIPDLNSPMTSYLPPGRLQRVRIAYTCNLAAAVDILMFVDEEKAVGCHFWFLYATLPA